MISPLVTDSTEKRLSDSTPYRERILASRAKVGNHAAFIRLCEPSSARAFNAIQRKLKNRDDSEDVLQETLFRAFLPINEFHDDSGFATRLMRIGIDAPLMLIWKRHCRHISIDEPNERGREWVKIDPSLIPEEQVVVGEAVWRLRREISHLPLVVRSVVEIRHMHDAPLKETAASLDISLSAAKSRLVRAKRRLYISLTH